MPRKCGHFFDLIDLFSPLKSAQFNGSLKMTGYATRVAAMVIFSLSSFALAFGESSYIKINSEGTSRQLPETNFIYLIKVARFQECALFMKIILGSILFLERHVIPNATKLNSRSIKVTMSKSIYNEWTNYNCLINYHYKENWDSHILCGSWTMATTCL